LLTYWREAYDWRAVEAQMNAYDHQLVDIDGIPIHFMRVPGKGPTPTPIVLTHGWPWTFWDLHKVVDPLADPASYGGDPADSFDVIVPSLPGYGFSVPLPTTGVDIPCIAELWVTLMRDVLGYDRFGAQGGDWGAFVTAQLGHAHAEHRFNMSFASSIRLYAQQFSKPPQLAHDRLPLMKAPTGFGVFPKELLFIPKAVAECHTNLHRWTVFDHGGHFAPAERPDAVVDELRAFFRALS
jgi:pimeloyl-ACP methyl ester carboxylesterase